MRALTLPQGRLQRHRIFIETLPSLPICICDQCIVIANQLDDAEKQQKRFINGDREYPLSTGLTCIVCMVESSAISRATWRDAALCDPKERVWGTRSRAPSFQTWQAMAIPIGPKGVCMIRSGAMMGLIEVSFESKGVCGKVLAFPCLSRDVSTTLHARFLTACLRCVPDRVPRNRRGPT